MLKTVRAQTPSHSCMTTIGTETVNPLSANSDLHQFSPNDIHTMSRD